MPARDLPSRDLTRPEWQAVLDASTSLVTSQDEHQLLQDVCHNAVRVGGYELAWYGRLSHDGTHRITLVAESGTAAEYARGVAITWDDLPTGQGPGGMAAKTGHTVTATDINETPLPIEIRERAAEFGLRSITCIPITVNGRIDGVLAIYSARIGAFDDLANSILGALCLQVGVGLERLRAAVRTTEALQDTIKVLTATLEARDPYTAGHQAAVAALSERVAVRLGLTDFEVRGVGIAALVHDIGKVGVPIELLLRPGALRPPERLLIQEHVTIGEEVLGGINFPWPIAQVVGQHHERLNGTGYPRGLDTDDILLPTKIVAVADVLEAMSSHRPYRQGHGLEQTVQHIQHESGTLYDPEVVKAVCAIRAQDLFAPAAPAS